MKALILVSGGIDSSTCLALAVSRYGPENCIALSLSYGQKHEKELDCAREIARHYGVELIESDLSAIFRYSNSSLLSHSDAPVPKSTYADQKTEAEGSPVSTYVPFRNGLFISVAAGIAISKGCDEVYYGAHMDDAAGSAYPDCSREFFDAMNQALITGSGEQIKLIAPFIDLSKADIVRMGLSLKVPYELTWSCYEGGEKPCGTCATCLDRAGAFAANGIFDPAIV